MTDKKSIKPEDDKSKAGGVPDAADDKGVDEAMYGPGLLNRLLLLPAKAPPPL